MKPLIVELFSGKETVPRGVIVLDCLMEHVRRGGVEDNNLGQSASAFKSACRDLVKLGIMEDAGIGYWHILSGFIPEDAMTPIPKKPGRGN